MASEEVVEKKKTRAKEHEDEIIAKLGELGGNRARDTSIRFGRGFQLPEEYKDDLEAAVTYLGNYVEEQESQTEFSRTFMRRPWDGAVCMVNAMQKNFGTSGRQRGTGFFFFRQPPEQRSIPVNAEGDTVQVPWGLMDFPLFKGTIMCDSTRHRTYGTLFRVTIRAAKKYASQVEGFFRLIEEECKNHSIYQAKAIDGQENPEFIDPYTVEQEKIIFSTEVSTQLQANLWSPLIHSDTHRALDLGLKRTILVYGEYGTGKTMTTARTLQVAVENNWTGIICRPGRDDLDKVMQTARLYQPCVLIVEDIETAASTDDAYAVSRLLDLFDGVQAKGVEMIAVLTTNHIDQIHRGMMRPGRLDAVIELGDLDRDGVAKLVESLVDSDKLSDIDYDKVYESMKEYPPAFCNAAVDRALRYAIDRANGEPDTITTHDIVEAANGLRPQFLQMRAASEEVKADGLGGAFEHHMERVLTNRVGMAADPDLMKATEDGETVAPFVQMPE